MSRIQSNIARVLLEEEEKSVERKGINSRNARGRNNYLRRLTVSILDTFKSCNPNFEYTP